MRHSKKIVWNPGQGRQGGVSVDPTSDSAQPFTGPGATRGLSEAWSDLAPGSLVTVKAHGLIERTNYGGGVPPCPFLDVAHWGDPQIASGSIGMYLGAIRTNERGGGKFEGTTRMLRHTFTFGGKKYVVWDLSVLEPMP